MLVLVLFFSAWASLLNFLAFRMKSDMALTLLRTMFARGIASVGALIFLVVLGRLYGAGGVGVYALAQSIVLGASIFARYGMDNALMRYVGQEHTSQNVVVFLRWACVKALLLSGCASVGIFLGCNLLEDVFDTEGLAEVLVGIAAATPAFTLGFILSDFFKGVRKPATACLLENGSVALVSALLVLIWNWVDGSRELAAIGWVYAIAAWLVLLQGCWQFWRWRKSQGWTSGERVEHPKLARQQFKQSSQAFFVMSLAGFMQSVLSVLIAGWLLSSDGLGLFKAAQQAAILIGFILIVINAIFPPRFASFYQQGDISALGRLARQGAVLGTVFSGPLLLVCLFFPNWVLGLLGNEFLQASPLLRLLALAQLVNVATGSVGFLLNMTGREKLMRNVALICNAIGLVLFLVLIPLFGPMGAAMALAFVLVTQNLVALYFVWRCLGVWTLPLPNVLVLLGINPYKDMRLVR